MYYRVMNKIDAELFGEHFRNEISCDVIDRMKEIIETLDTAYGVYRSTRAYGGYVLLFPTRKCFEGTIEQLREFYGIKENMSEYVDQIGAENSWCEELYLLSSEDSLVLLYPEV